jgi:ferredoxin
MLQALKRLGSVFKSQRIIYIKYDPSLCVHVQDGKVSCTLCVDNCPGRGITPAGDKVQFDPALCAGCGNCAKVCPTGAAKYEPTTAE